MGAHPYPQTVGAANDWVLTMLAIRAHEKMVRGLLARAMWEATHSEQQTVGVFVCREPGKRALSLGFVQRNWGRGERGLCGHGGYLCHSPSPPSLLAKLELITDFSEALGGDVVKMVLVRVLEPSSCEKALDEPSNSCCFSMQFKLLQWLYDPL